MGPRANLRDRCSSPAARSLWSRSRSATRWATASSARRPSAVPRSLATPVRRPSAPTRDAGRRRTGSRSRVIAVATDPAFPDPRVTPPPPPPPPPTARHRPTAARPRARAQPRRRPPYTSPPLPIPLVSHAPDEALAGPGARGADGDAVAQPPRRLAVSSLPHFIPDYDRDNGGNGITETDRRPGRSTVKRGLAQMLKGGVIMDVVTPEQAAIAQEAGAVAVMALERIPADIRAAGGVARMSDLSLVAAHHGRGHDPGDGQGSHRPLRRGADASRRSASTTSTSPKC